MFRFILRRLLFTIPTLLGVFTIVFFSIRLIPGDPAALIAGINARPEVIEEIRRSYELDKPIWVQYGLWLSRVSRGDMGQSIMVRQPVRGEVLTRFRNSAVLATASIVLSMVFGITLGVLAAMFSRTWFDRLIMFVVLLGVSLPVFWVGLLLIIQFSVTFKWLPPQGMSSPLGGGWDDTLRHLVLPAVTLSLPPIAIITRLTRSALLDVMRRQYILAARARGFTELRVYLRHALPNVTAPIITIIGAQLGYMLGGAVLVEVLFSWPGLGQLMVEAVFNRDYPLVQGSVLVTATVFVLLNLVVDLLYGVFDPRVREAR